MVDLAYCSEDEMTFRIASGSNGYHFFMSTVFGDGHSKIAAVQFDFHNLLVFF